MKLALLILVIIKSSFAFEAVITALEAPLFRVQDDNSKVIQYLRKGDIIKIHKSDTFDPFYKTFTTTSDQAYILKEHVYVYYNDSKELEQNISSIDNTDYRIPEPLPKDYPLIRPLGYRGQMYFSFGGFNSENYPYSEKIRDSSKDSFLSIDFLWSKGFDEDLSRRKFIGILTSVSNSKSTFLFDSATSTEQVLKIATGPYYSYDTWKNEDYILNIHSSLLFNFYDNVEIARDRNSQLDKAEYYSYSLQMKSGVSFIIKHFLDDFDFITGLGVNFALPSEYKIKSQSGSNNFQNSFNTGFNSQLAITIGIQSDY